MINVTDHYKFMYMKKITTLLVDTPTMPSSTGGAAITKLTTPPAMETICAWRTLFADNKRIMYVFQGIPPSVCKIEITTYVRI